MLHPTFKLKFLLATTLPLQFFNIKQERKRLILKELFLQLILLRLIINYISHSKLKVASPYLTRKLFMTTRAPYRYKLTRNQYMLARYNYIFFFEHSQPHHLSLEQVYPYLQALVSSFANLNFLHGNLTSVKLSLPCTLTLAV